MARERSTVVRVEFSFDCNDKVSSPLVRMNRNSSFACRLEAFHLLLLAGECTGHEVELVLFSMSQ